MEQNDVDLSDIYMQALATSIQREIEHQQRQKEKQERVEKRQEQIEKNKKLEEKRAQHLQDNIRSADRMNKVQNELHEQSVGGQNNQHMNLHSSQIIYDDEHNFVLKPSSPLS